jgi:hypothetical protein
MMSSFVVVIISGYAWNSVPMHLNARVSGRKRGAHGDLPVMAYREVA